MFTDPAPCRNTHSYPTIPYGRKSRRPLTGIALGSFKRIIVHVGSLFSGQAAHDAYHCECCFCVQVWAACSRGLLLLLLYPGGIACCLLSSPTTLLLLSRVCTIPDPPTSAIFSSLDHVKGVNDYGKTRQVLLTEGYYLLE